ncbi:MAG: transketolase [Opitutales bacterium]|nr:transketolase [Opitutales bacterium]
MENEKLAKACMIARGLSIDAIHSCSSGHLGLPLGATEIGAILFGHSLRYNPVEPDWINRDRFVLSAGHGSMFLYSWLHISGYDLPLEEIRNFRQLHSKTPGHPEFGETPGVESTTGPLGQGVGNAVGMAMASKMAAAHFNTQEHTIFDNKVVVLAGDGCLQEGLTSEAAALAGHLRLDNLILIYDSNDVTLDAMAEVTQSEDTCERFESYGFDTHYVEEGHDLNALLEAYEKARNNTSGKPQFIEVKTIIGKGIPEVSGTAAGHGEGGAKFAESARKGLGLPAETFHVSDDVKSYFANHQQKLQENHEDWTATFEAWKTANPSKAVLLQSGLDNVVPDDLDDSIPEFSLDSAATRGTGGKALNAIAEKMPLLVSGSADLHGSTKNYLNKAGDFSWDNPTGRNILFGIREHAMGAIINGFAYHGIFRCSGATFATFSDYMRPSVRLAALVGLPVFYIWTHDSVGVGEDGPTHQPVETTSALRCIPNLDVIRPADAEETAGAFAAAVERIDGPTALILTRQSVPALSDISVHHRRQGVRKGGYIARKETGDLQLILLASGSEVQHALKVATELGNGIRVVSMPCMERFDRQPADYRESVIPSNCKKRVAIEAGVSALWHKYTGLDGRVVGIDRFGISAPGDVVMQELGITAENLASVARQIL